LDDDREEDIVEAGRKLFGGRGFKATNISEIAHEAGIAVGSFYKFFASKEELFLRVYLEENEALKRRLFESVDDTADPVDLVTSLVSRNAIEMNENPILREWYNQDLMAKLEKRFEAQRGVASIHELMDAGVRQMVLRWQAAGRMRRDIEPEMIIAMFKSVAYIDLHKAEIGPEFFPEVLTRISEFIIRGLQRGEHETST
jgi:AcrR family transcriptional regulator